MISLNMKAIEKNVLEALAEHCRAHPDEIVMHVNGAPVTGRDMLRAIESGEAGLDSVPYTIEPLVIGPEAPALQEVYAQEEREHDEQMAALYGSAVPKDGKDM